MNQEPGNEGQFADPPVVYEAMTDPYALPPEVIPAAARAQVLASGQWFYWIAGLSLLNSVIAHQGGGLQFIAGLGITQVADAVIAQVGGAGATIALTFDAVVSAVFIALGAMARRCLIWPFVVGMVLYLLDTLLLVFFQDWYSTAFHAFALFSISGGFRVLWRLQTPAS